MERFRKYYTKRNKSDRERQINGWLPEGRGMCGTAEIGEWD